MRCRRCSCRNGGDVNNLRINPALLSITQVIEVIQGICICTRNFLDPILAHGNTRPCLTSILSDQFRGGEHELQSHGSKGQIHLRTYKMLTLTSTRPLIRWDQSTIRHYWLFTKPPPGVKYHCVLLGIGSSHDPDLSP